MLYPKSIGNKIVEARKKSNMSQAELAQHVSISPQAIGKWERGESMPDISTLHKLAEIFNVDLNYFSDTYHKDESSFVENEIKQKEDEPAINNARERFDWNWDMSQGNWIDADFSGLKNLKDKFSSSNIKNCKFIQSDLSALTLSKNNIERCDFSASDLRDSKILSSYLSQNQFNNCSFIDAHFTKNSINKCDFSEANFSGAEFSEISFVGNNVTNAVWDFTSFKDSELSDTVFEGNIENCHFENCAFSNVKFQNATIIKTFFKHNRKLKKVEFIDCVVDNLTYAFLKHNDANLKGVKIL